MYNLEEKGQLLLPGTNKRVGLLVRSFFILAFIAQRPIE